MTEISSSHVTNQKPMANAMELNNNNSSEISENSLNLKENARPRCVSRDAIVSSASSSNSDTSEDNESANFEDETKNGEETNETSNKEFDIRKLFRSMSDGQAGKVPNQELTDVFPSLPNSLLDKLGLHGEAPRERMSEEELEQKFIALALAFTIDAATIKDRCERQRRYRDQTETNLISEIDRLIERVNHMQPMCVDYETAELLTGLLAQIDIVIKAASHAAISAERFGAVQHEDRLAEAVSLMINHVTVLKQQRDSTRKQLQYTKKVLQDTNSPESPNTKPRLSVSTNGRIITKRRASIATISQPQDPNRSPTGANGVNLEIRRITRRTSDLTSRASAFARSSRPSRLELGVDLDKIKEGIAENGTPIVHKNAQNDQSEESENDTEIENNIPNTNTIETIDIDISNLPLQQRIIYKCKKFNENIQKKYERYSNDGTLHEFFYLSAFLCFVLAIIVLGNLLIEFRFARLGYWTEENTYWNSMFSNYFVGENKKNKVNA